VWRTAICGNACGGRCLNKAYIVDGVVVRQKTDDTHEDSLDFPQIRGCLRGRSYRHFVYSPDRVKYPMKRKGWQPGGGANVNGAMRGKDEWERISWDEALDYIGGEVKRITEAYGPTSIMVIGSEARRTFALNGGYISGWGAISQGTFIETGPCIGTYMEREDLDIKVADRLDQNDRMEFRNSELVVGFGSNIAWNGMGYPMYYLRAVKEAGAEFVFIDPFYNNTCISMGGEWVPIRPGTDHALMLGMMYTLLQEDDPTSNPLIDWDFLNRCTVGFDADHMPEGANPQDNLRDYIMGTYDGIPKTPEWAYDICGVEPDVMNALARRIATTEKTAIICGYVIGRIANADAIPQILMAFGAMTGCIGKSGCMTGTSVREKSLDGGPELVFSGKQGVPAIDNPDAVVVRVNNNELWTATLTGKYTRGKDDIRDINVQMIFQGGVATTMNQQVANTKAIEAYRKVEFVLTSNIVYDTGCRYSDIVLPVSSHWEMYADPGLNDNRKKEVTFYGTQILDPMFESKEDLWIAEQITNRIGLDGKLANPLTIEQRMLNYVSTVQVRTLDNTGYENLVAITQEDIDALGLEGAPQEGRISYQQFVEDGKYQVERSYGDQYHYIAHKEFRDDPEGHPLPTESGKFEIYSQSLADTVNAHGFSTIVPYPAYNRPVEGYEDSFADWENKVPGPLPLQLVTIHYPGHAHSMFVNLPQIREAFPTECWISSKDANERGLQENDVALIESRHGKVLRHVHITERVMPGVILIGEGAWTEIDEATGIDKAGNTNTLNGPIATGQGHAGYNSCLVEVTKSDMPLEPDYLWPARLTME
jgi:anaerobic dimethyl sulfoxide reductase subunit A